jgi:hypothetical protein
MDAVQTNPQAFNYLPKAPLLRTLDDMRMVHDNYATSGSFSASSMRPVLIAALVIAAGAGIVVGVNKYSDYNAAKISAASSMPDPTVPLASSVPATSNVAVPAETITAKDSPVTDPMKTMTKSEEANSMPLAGQGNNHSSESMNPVKAKSSVAAKSAPALTKKIAPLPASPAFQLAPATVAPAPIVPPQQDMAPPSPPVLAPAPIIIEEKPPAPIPVQEPPVVAPAPTTPPVEPPKL